MHLCIPHAIVLLGCYGNVVMDSVPNAILCCGFVHSTFEMQVGTNNHFRGKTSLRCLVLAIRAGRVVTFSQNKYIMAGMIPAVLQSLYFTSSSPYQVNPTKSAATIAAKKSSLLASNARTRKKKTTMHEQEEKLIVLRLHEAQQLPTSSLLDAPSVPSKAPPPSLPLLHSSLTTQPIYHPTGQPHQLPHHTHHSQTCAVPPNVEPQGLPMAIPLGSPYIIDTHVAGFPPSEPMREAGVKLEGPEMADACLQTSGIFEAQSAGFPPVSTDRLVVEVRIHCRNGVHVSDACSCVYSL